LRSEKGAARAVLGIAVFVFPAGIVKDREQPDHLRIRAMDVSKVKTVAADLEPMAWSMVGVRMKAELGGDELPEGDFGVGEHWIRAVRSGSKSKRVASITPSGIVSTSLCHRPGAAGLSAILIKH
jgi:hypothetical protein